MKEQSAQDFAVIHQPVIRARADNSLKEDSQGFFHVLLGTLFELQDDEIRDSKVKSLRMSCSSNLALRKFRLRRYFATTRNLANNQLDFLIGRILGFLSLPGLSCASSSKTSSNQRIKTFSGESDNADRIRRSSPHCSAKQSTRPSSSVTVTRPWPSRARPWGMGAEGNSRDQSFDPS